LARLLLIESPAEGRIGKPSQSRIDLHATEQDAQAAMQRKGLEKRRRGYC
jgi:predicted DNA-binding WGR domain protein